MTLEIEAIRKSSKVLDMIAERIPDITSREITISLDEFTAVIEGYRAAISPGLIPVS